MTSLQHKKIILGSTYKAYRRAKISGQICLIDLDLLDIILDLATNCHLTLDFDTQQCLERQARLIQGMNKDFCSYRNININDKKFLD